MTMESSTGGQRRIGFVHAMAGIAALGGLLFGYDTGVISGAILFVREDFHLSPEGQEIVVSAVLLGAIVGALLGGVTADRLGRRMAILLTAATFTVGSIATALAPNVASLVVGRFVIGMAIGVASFTVPLYISEAAPPAARGWLVSLNQLAITIGILTAYVVDYSFAEARGWRWMFALGAVPSTILALGMCFLPDSPRWLLSHGMPEKALAILVRMRGKADAAGELKAIRETLLFEGGGWRDVLAASLRPALVVGIGLALFQQITGINTVIYYAPTIFQAAGFRSASAAILATAGVGLVNVAMTVVGMWLIDRVGRRPLLLVGVAGMVLSLAVLGLGFFLRAEGRLLGWVSVGSLMVYVGTFAIGLGPVFWLLIAEIYPLRIRGLAMSIATVANWGSNFVVALTFLTLTHTITTAGTFWLYASVGVGAWVFIYFLVPETKGRSLEEIEAELHGRGR